MTTTTLVVPSSSEAHVLAANTPLYVGAQNTPLTVHIPSGVTASVSATCDPAVAQFDGTGSAVDWVDVSGGAKAGPLLISLAGPYAALKLTSVAGGQVNISRTPKV